LHVSHLHVFQIYSIASALVRFARGAFDSKEINFFPPIIRGSVRYLPYPITVTTHTLR
jgi:hypothetical protein